MPSETQLAALATFAPAAVEAEKETGLPAEITLAQAIFESAWFTRHPGENFFGIKSDAHGSGVDYVLTEEYLDGRWEKMPLAFETYPTAADSFADHARLITQGKPYAAAWAQFSTPPLNWNMDKYHDAEALMWAIGPIYATAPGYAAEMVSMMREPYLVSAVQSARAVS